MAKFRQRVVAEAEIIGQDMVVDTRNEVSTPVVRDSSGFHVVQRSPVFSNPWLETGNLWREMYYTMWPDQMDLVFFNAALYARILNDGHGATSLSRGIAAEPRPFMDFAREKWRQLVPGRIAAAV